MADHAVPAADDQARIAAEIQGTSAGTDPFVEAVRATRMPMIITNPRLDDNPVVFVNDAFCRLTGYPREEIVGRNCRFLQGPQTDPETVRRIRLAVRDGARLEIDIRNHCKDGTPFWNRLLMAPVHDANGTLTYFFASQLDVTLERERLADLESSNAALRTELSDRLRSQAESEGRLRIATEGDRLGIWELDLRTRKLMASRRCRSIFGRDPNLPFTYADLLASIHPEDRERTMTAARRSVAMGADYHIEYRVLRTDGTAAWVEVRAQVERGADGRPLHLAGISIDITARKRTEERTLALVRLNDALRVPARPAELAYSAAAILGEVLGVSRAGYGTVDLAAETITIERDWNAPGIASLAGTLAFRDYGSYIDDLKRGETVTIADAEKDIRTQATAKALIGISAHSFINMPVTERGGLVALLYLNHAAAREWLPEELAFIRDVASRTRMAVERRRVERDLQELTASLEVQVAARTRELMQAEESLRQSQKMEAVGQLTGGLAHDFNNLLTGITGSMELLRTRIGQGRLEDADRYLGAAQGAARRAAALTHRLLAFSRRQTLSPKPLDINGLVAGMEELVGRTVGPAVRLEVVAAPGLWTTLVDASQLENALLNLCINARDAMPDGGLLTIQTANRWMDQHHAEGLPTGRYVSLCVSDTGTGMTPDVASKAFDPFFTTKPIGQGTGLGLSMIYGFAQQSGGQARITTELGKGTTVCLHLPRHEGKAAVPETEAAPEAAPHARPGATVLVVDDEPTLRMLLIDVLTERGYRTIEAESGAAGLDILSSPQPVDLLISDVGLPGGLNGRQMADAALALRPQLKVLFITGYAESAVIDYGQLGPGMHVLTKPFAIETLASRVKALVE